MQILHISDLHCIGDRHAEQMLREGHYREYVRNFASCLLSRNYTPEVLCVTGDLAHQNSRDHSRGFELAVRSINLLAEHLGIESGNVFVVPGNHDYERDAQRNSQFADARRKYEEVVANQFAHISRCGECFWKGETINCSAPMVVLGIDSTWGDTDCRPGKIAADEINERLETDMLVGVVEAAPAEHLLCILSHYPISTFDAMSALDGEPDYARDHLAMKFEVARRRIQKLRRPNEHLGPMFVAPTIWLHGDVHKDSIHPSAPFVISIVGRFDNPRGATTTFRRHARLIDVTRSESEWTARAVEIEWKADTHNDLLDAGEWDTGDYKRLFSIAAPKGETAVTVQKVDTIDDAAVEALASTELARAAPIAFSSSCEPVVSSDELSEVIKDFVHNNGLLFLHRARAADEIDRLTHVELGPLFNDIDIRGNMLRCFSDHIVSNSSGQRVGLIGVDVWGSAMARELGVRTGNQSIAITLRMASDDLVKRELIRESKLSNLATWTKVYFVTDVIATGSTLKRVYRLIRECMGLDDEVRFVAIALICPKWNRHRNGMEFVETILTACDQLQLTSIESSELPPETFLPTCSPPS